MLLNLSKECGFKLVDLYPYFRDYENKENLYYKYDVHLTPLGNQYAAEIVSKQISKDI